MLPLFIDIAGGIVSYLMLMYLYTLGEQLKTHSIALRLAPSIFAYTAVLFVLDYLFHLVLVSVEFFSSRDIGTAFAWVGLFTFTGGAIRVLYYFEDAIQLTEMMNYGWTALRLGNYFRKRDADTRDMIGTFRMKTIYEEVHGKPFTGAELATAFDEQVTKFKKVPIEALKETIRKPPPEYASECALLQEKQVTDVTVSFRFALFENTDHPYLTMMEQWVINPVERELSIDLIFPSEKKIPVDSPAEQSRLIERIYESLHVLIAQEFFRLYEAYISFIAVRCSRKEFNDTMMEEMRPLLRFRISLHRLRQRASRITTESEIRRIAAVEFIHQQ